jgi:hypothetical protein
MAPQVLWTEVFVADFSILTACPVIIPSRCGELGSQAMARARYVARLVPIGVITTVVEKGGVSKKYVITCFTTITIRQMLVQRFFTISVLLLSSERISQTLLVSAKAVKGLVAKYGWVLFSSPGHVIDVSE